MLVKTGCASTRTTSGRGIRSPNSSALAMNESWLGSLRLMRGLAVARSQICTTRMPSSSVVTTALPRWLG